MLTEKIEIVLININVYKKDNSYEDNDITYIPECIEKILTNKYNSEIENLIKYDNFNEIYGNAFGGVGCGTNEMSFYKTENNKYNLIEDDYEFGLHYHYGGSEYNIFIEINEKIKNDVKFIEIINKIKITLNNLWNYELQYLAKSEIKKAIIKNNKKISNEVEN
jgi:hypothetical protein